MAPKPKKQKQPKFNPYPTIAEMIRQQGEGKDSILAHINAEEAEMLAQMSGGDINPKTGLPQFGFFNKPGKALRSIAGGAAGAVIGNMILPGVGGVIGGAIGQGVQHKMRNKSPWEGALKGGAMGASIPGLSSILGSGASALGASTAGSALSNYGAQNAILPSLARMGIGSSGALGVNTGSSMGSMGGNALRASAGSSPLSSNAANSLASGMGQNSPAASEGFMGKLMGNTGSFLSKPKNLLALASAAGSFANRPKPVKEKSPEQLADESKRYSRGLLLTPEEMAQKEAHMLAEEQARRRVERNKFLPEERLGNIEPLYARTNSPDEYEKSKRWLTYYNNPHFTGDPVMFKEGGYAHPHEMYEEIDIEEPDSMGLGRYIQGTSGGQDDKVNARVSPGEYVFDSSTVSDLGDGNNAAGAKKLEHMIRNIRKHKRGGSIGLPPKAKPLAHYMRG
jgi:hypothetical protein